MKKLQELLLDNVIPEIEAVIFFQILKGNRTTVKLLRLCLKGKLY